MGRRGRGQCVLSVRYSNGAWGNGGTGNPCADAHSFPLWCSHWEGRLGASSAMTKRRVRDLKFMAPFGGPCTKGQDSVDVSENPQNRLQALPPSPKMFFGNGYSHCNTRRKRRPRRQHLVHLAGTAVQPLVWRL